MVDLRSYKRLASVRLSKIPGRLVFAVTNSNPIQPHSHLFNHFASGTLQINCEGNNTFQECITPKTTVFTGKFVALQQSKTSEGVPEKFEAPETRYPVNDQGNTCTDMSLTYPDWEVDELDFSGSEQRSDITFKLKNKATAYIIFCRSRPSSGSVAEWIRCEKSRQEKDYSTITYVRYQAEPAMLFINQTWFCQDYFPSKS
jgi:hypothetical protein